MNGGKLINGSNIAKSHKGYKTVQSNAHSRTEGTTLKKTDL